MNHRCEVDDNLKCHDRDYAVLICWEKENGELWVGNNEYSNQVYFCPFCGYGYRE